MDRILLVAENGIGKAGGIQTIIMNNVVKLRDQFCFDVVVFCSDRSDNENIISEQGNVYRIICDQHSSRMKRTLEYVTRPFRVYSEVRKILKMNSYQAIHVNDINKGAAALLAAKLGGVKVRIAQCHNPRGTEKRSTVKKMYLFLGKWILNGCTNCKIGVSTQANAYMFGNKNAKQAIVINNAVDLRKYNKESRSAIRGHNFVHIGRFTEQKNHEFLIRTFSYIQKEFPDATLRLIGWGELQEKIENLIYELNLVDHVSILPYDTDGPEVLSKSDYMIFPSRYEGFGIVLIEAQAMQVKCFASTVVPRTTNVGLCSYLALEDGEQSWAREIIGYINSDKGCSEKVDRIALSKFDADVIAAEYAKIYRGELCI